MASVIEESGSANRGSASDPSQGRFRRLDGVDRQAAELLIQVCTANCQTSATATRLANRAQIQNFLTAFPLAMADVASFGLSLWLAAWLASRVVGWALDPLTVDPCYLFLSLIVLPNAHVIGLYPGLGLGSVMEFRQLARMLFASSIFLTGIGCFVAPAWWAYFLFLGLLAYAIAVPSCMVIRFLTRLVVKHFSWWGVPTLIVAEPKLGLELYRRMQYEVVQGFRPAGLLIDPNHYWAREDLLSECQVPVHDMRQAGEVAMKLGATWVIAMPGDSRSMMLSMDPALAAIPNRILLSSNHLDLSLWDQIFCIGSSTGLRFGGAHPSSWQLTLKRMMDAVLTAVVLLVGLPILIVLCLLVRMSSRGPIFYSQERVGRGGRKFRAWKFRTMRDRADEILDQYLARNEAARKEWDETHKLAADPRVTRIGQFLRSSSFDELPQLWNVLWGDMSLVGPRPLIDSPTYDGPYIRDYPREFEAYKTFRPGLTGLWQVRSRNSGVYELRIFWDMYYIRNWCIWLDLYLILRTIKTVLMREGM
jgi:Undecaprenyl-phosphate galactose phosphotransferase WbaP